MFHFYKTSDGMAEWEPPVSYLLFPDGHVETFPHITKNIPSGWIRKPDGVPGKPTWGRSAEGLNAMKAWLDRKFQDSLSHGYPILASSIPSPYFPALRYLGKVKWTTKFGSCAISVDTKANGMRRPASGIEIVMPALQEVLHNAFCQTLTVTYPTKRFAAFRLTDTIPDLAWFQLLASKPFVALQQLIAREWCQTCSTVLVPNKPIPSELPNWEKEYSVGSSGSPYRVQIDYTTPDHDGTLTMAIPLDLMADEATYQRLRSGVLDTGMQEFILALQSLYPSLSVDRSSNRWRLHIDPPDRLQEGHTIHIDPTSLYVTCGYAQSTNAHILATLRELND